MKNSKNFIIQELIKPREIATNLHYGINLPVSKKFQRYCISDLTHFNSFSWLLSQDNKIVGHVLLFYENREILYFGFFRINDDDPVKISYLVDKVIAFAHQRKFKMVQGPINIPTVLYGWGFMKEDKVQTVYRGCPINSPLYNSIFTDKGFQVKHTIVTLEGPIPQISGDILTDYDYSDYELIHLNNWTEFFNYSGDYFKLVAENLSPEHSYTPNIEALSDNYVQIEIRFGHPFMLTFIKHIPSDKIIGHLVSLPNPFKKNLKGQYDSITLFTIVIDKKYQRKGLGLLLVKTSCDKARSHNMIYTTGPVDATNGESLKLGKKIGLVHMRTHEIFEYYF